MGTDFLESIRRYNIRAARPDPGKCALLVIDMQNYFEPVAAPILDKVLAAAAACRAKKIPVIYSRHGHEDLSRDGGMLAKWWGECIMRDTPDWELLPEIQVEMDDTVIDKKRYSVFRETELERILREKRIEELIIAGVLTNCCCETTARDGYVRDYRVFFLCDATAAVSEELHIASLKNLAFGFAHIVDTKSLCRWFSV